MAEKIYPEWVQKQKVKGTAVKKVGENYYLYKHTSKRVPGKKYPVPVDTYIGVITPDGVIQGSRKKIRLTDIEVREYGFSRVLWLICPDSWKKPLGKDWEDVLSRVIKQQSPATYLDKERGGIGAEETHYQISSMVGNLSRRLNKERGILISYLEPLKMIYILYHDNGRSLSKMNDEQLEILKTLGVDISLC